jgi:L-fuculose-phosphate aldolase
VKKSIVAYWYCCTAVLQLGSLITFFGKGKPLKDNKELRQDIIDTCLWLRSYQYVYGTWGNISVKLDDGSLLITPSRVEYDELKCEDMVVMAPDGSVISGSHLPTSEREVHRRIMNIRPDIGAIIHSHSVYAMAASALDHGIPPITEEMCQLLGGGIPLSKYFVPSSKHNDLGDAAAESIGQANALLLRNHGPVCCGKDLKEARLCCQIVEKSAQMYMHLQDKHITTISDEWVKNGRDYYINAYGKT